MLAGFWPQPIQWIGIALGSICTLLATALGIYGIWFWIDRSNFPGPLLGGVAVPAAGYSADGEQLVRDRLSGLGYLG